jgi:release factor glutamine methyltransferase
MAGNVASLLRAAAARLSGAEARFEAELLLMHALACDRAWLFAHPDALPGAEALARFEALLVRRANGEPLAYLTGRRGFWSLDLDVSPAVLIPRPDTELLVELALEKLAGCTRPRVLDLGTGSGAIALAIAAERPDARVLATDASREALAVARSNARRHGLEHVELRHGDWWQTVAGERFDLVVSNPPYVAEDDPHLDRGDLPHEPRAALVSGADGLDALRIIAARAAAHLLPGGWLLLEHGHAQGEAVRALLRTAGLADIATRCDVEGRERASLARRVPGPGPGRAKR